MTMTKMIEGGVVVQDSAEADYFLTHNGTIEVIEGIY